MSCQWDAAGRSLWQDISQTDVDRWCRCVMSELYACQSSESHIPASATGGSYISSVIKCCVCCVWCCVCVCVSHLRQGKQHCCPLLQSAETRPGLRGRTCPSDPSAPACPRSPPWTTCFLLALGTTWDQELLPSHGKCSEGSSKGLSPGREARLFAFSLQKLPSRSKWAHWSWMAFEMDISSCKWNIFVCLMVPSITTKNGLAGVTV